MATTKDLLKQLDDAILHASVLDSKFAKDLLNAKNSYILNSEEQLNGNAKKTL